MYQSVIEGINSILRECWRLYSEPTAADKLSALKLAKECHESIFHLTHDGPYIHSIHVLSERLEKLENSRR
jgi:hypothetical protein